nr:MAG: undecaprenyl/decaprenyl-phosphate alpha-N-acetylglucosaminyl 1-phosphate transferase [bacterium]
MATPLISFATAFLLSLALTYKVRGWAPRLGLVDMPDGVRRVHDRPMPRAGGVAVYAAVALVLAVAWAAGGLPGYPEASGAGLVLKLMAGGAGMFLLGLWDDARQLPARVKLAGQVLVAVAAYVSGIRIDTLSLLGGPLPEWLSLGVTVFWLVGITNAFNLIDGSDGVAAGSAIFAALAVAAVLALGGDPWGTTVALTLAGAALGFLFFNFPPASIFLGDSGSLFLGFMLGALGVITSQKAPTALAVLIPVISFGVPILDTLLAVVRRFLRAEPLFKADRRHIHHRLRELGHSPRKVALLVYMVSALFALLSLLLVRPGGHMQAAVFVVLGLVVLIGVQRLDVPELLELRRLVHRGLHPRRVIARNVRIREAVDALGRARSGAEVVAALEHALAAGEFVRAELWLPERLGRVLADARAVQRAHAGYRWAWAAADRPSDELWELRLPFRGADGLDAGQLCLWQRVQDEHPLADVRLIATQLQPALVRALGRIGDQGAVPALSPAPRVAMAVAGGDRARLP